MTASLATAAHTFTASTEDRRRCTCGKTRNTAAHGYDPKARKAAKEATEPTPFTAEENTALAAAEAEELAAAQAAVDAEEAAREAAWEAAQQEETPAAPLSADELLDGFHEAIDAHNAAAITEALNAADNTEEARVEAARVVLADLTVEEESPADTRQERATELADAVAAGAVSFDAAAAELLGGAPVETPAAKPVGTPAAAVADDAWTTALTADTGTAPELVNVYVGASVAALVMDRAADADPATASVAIKLRHRQPNAQNYRHVKLSAAERTALAAVATEIENEAVASGAGTLARAARTLRGRIAATL
jgi:hypothetical protein